MRETGGEARARVADGSREGARGRRNADANAPPLAVARGKAMSEGVDARRECDGRAKALADLK